MFSSERPDCGYYDTSSRSNAYPSCSVSTSISSLSCTQSVSDQRLEVASFATTATPSISHAIPFAHALSGHQRFRSSTLTLIVNWHCPTQSRWFHVACIGTTCSRPLAPPFVCTSFCRYRGRRCHASHRVRSQHHGMAAHYRCHTPTQWRRLEYRVRKVQSNPRIQAVRAFLDCNFAQSWLNHPNRINHSISLDEFKNIFYMEWGHRVLGRIIGIAFVLPLSYFAARKKLTTSMPAKLTGMALLLGFQGVLGWYMVKSGLEDSIMETPGAVPRVSQYRLAAHLGTAVLLYAGMLGTGLAVMKDWKYARNGGLWRGSTISWQEALSDPAVKRFTRYSRALTALVFVTALSGRWWPR